MKTSIQSARFSNLKVGIREVSFPFMQEPTKKQPLWTGWNFEIYVHDTFTNTHTHVHTWTQEYVTRMEGSVSDLQRQLATSEQQVRLATVPHKDTRQCNTMHNCTHQIFNHFSYV